MIHFKYDYNIVNNKIIININGDLNTYHCEKFKTFIYDLIYKFDDNKIVIINMAKLDYIDSSGVGCLIAIYKHLKNLDIKMLICNVCKNILHIFTTINLDKIFEIYLTEEDIYKYY